MKKKKTGRPRGSYLAASLERLKALHPSMWEQAKRDGEIVRFFADGLVRQKHERDVLKAVQFVKSALASTHRWRDGRI